MNQRLHWLGVTLLLIAVACGGGESGSTADDPPPADPTEEAAATEDMAEPADSAATVATADSDLGTILVDAEGRTLYLFDNDTDGESTCYEDCAANWPALVADGEPAAGDGADAALLGTVERTDGETQVTYNGQPLYYFAGDEAAGDVNGQAVGGIWWVVAPDGTAIKDSESSSLGGYGEY